MKQIVALALAGILLAPVADAQTAPGNSQEQLKAQLEQAGFTSVAIVPGAFVITAKDKSGIPVTLNVAQAGMAAPTAPATPATLFRTVPPADRLSSEVVGLAIYNDANQDIGTIKDIAYNATGVQAYIIGVGGVLGMGDRYVAVDPSVLSVSFDPTSKKWHANMNVTADQLNAAPAFKYPSNG